jgi:hypothetical protein
MRVLRMVALGLVGFSALAGAAVADGAGLWTVQATDIGSGMVCDVFAQGQAGRPAYEFRFRFGPHGILLIVAYSGERIAADQGSAEISIGDDQFTFPVKGTTFGDRNAVVISFDAYIVNYHLFDDDVPLRVRYGGQTFQLAFQAGDHVGDAMDRCMADAHLS